MDILYIGIIFFIIIIISYLSVLYYYYGSTESFQAGTGAGAGITNILDKRNHMKLCQYSIKSSYNSAYDGSKISKDALIIAISHSCRFLDLEIYLMNDIASVGYSIDPTITNLNSKNTIPLNDIFTTILSNCFSS